MASYNLNEVLKKKNAEKKQQSDNQEIHLDDVSRVKVLSPGRQVLKRFARNRLAVFGTILLLAMFVFSFLGPIFYPYGQKQIFYKYDAMNVDYAQAALQRLFFRRFRGACDSREEQYERQHQGHAGQRSERLSLPQRR